MQITLNLFLSLILEAVKAETQIKGNIDLATNENANALAYQETAGDETLHERKLMRSIYVSLETLKTEISEYLEKSGFTTADNSVTSTINEQEDTITIILNVNSRFNTSFTTTLARLFSNYIENYTLFLWWGAFNQQQAAFYANLQKLALTSIIKAFSKKEFIAPDIPYTKNISLDKNTFEIFPKEEHSIIYTIDNNVADDIDVWVCSKNIKWKRCPKNKRIDFFAFRPGKAKMRVFSTHSENVYADVDIIINVPENYNFNNDCQQPCQ